MNSSKVTKNRFTDEIEINIYDYSEEYRVWLEDQSLLYKNSQNYVSDAKFDSDIWIFLDELSKVFYTINFSELDDLLENKILDYYEIIVIKCWLVENIRIGYSLGTISRMVKSVFMIIQQTLNFNNDVLNSLQGDVIFEFTQRSNVSNYNYYIGKYIEYIDNLDLAHIGHYSTLTELMSYKMYSKSDLKHLPNSQDIFIFQYYLDRFYKEEENILLKHYYYPILLWWKITNVLPLRASEFCIKMKRDCIVRNNGKVYLKIERIKSALNSKRREGRIPLLKKVEVTEEISSMIEDYLRITAFDSDSNTLISYKAMLRLRKQCVESAINSDAVYGLRAPGKKKKFDTYFTSSELNRLIKSFYKTIIYNKYRYVDSIEKLVPSDTRHLAFMSLLLQGVSPIEIAMLGGHTTLESQIAYTGHIDYYIDSDVLSYISDSINKHLTDRIKSVKEIISEKSEICERPEVECRLMGDGVGYCTAVYKNGNIACEDVDDCVFCTKWWCPPTNESFIRVRQYLYTSKVSPLKKKVKEEHKYIMKLFKEAKIINIDGLLELDVDYNSLIRQSTFRLQCSSDNLIKYRKLLIDMIGMNEYDTCN